MKIGFFDSGIGGLTVLSEALKRLPHHDYLYYADTLHAPYGPKPKEEVRGYIFEAIEFLVRKGADIIVIACNTATSIAVNDLREKYQIPIIGMEPAVKPAIEWVQESGKRVLVTATPLTLKEEKLHHLIERLDQSHVTDLLPLPDLVRFAESFDFSPETVVPYLKKQLVDYQISDYGAIVLGCTHFPLFASSFKEVFEPGIELIDGSVGTVTHLANIIDTMKGETSKTSTVTFYQSGREITEANEIKGFNRILNQIAS
ncbi:MULTISPECIES: glutamate racemase [Turicibacter]|uniref:glutamate racemase n=1 Tax=Turicibacter TaxID=191303 RepID=UPI0006C3853D|nr:MULTISPECIES: glutamate racemase [Turicibacter]MBP3903685.1 glutamate racemase [Turicibacter sp.]MCU7210971.1 glutamate racemase [Turicibacter sanguinis]MDB8458180.1 glutamate racemase [Turicibacter sanguinis]MDB8574892.1 glutamate racemase [Turicibacter sanguinis]MDB8578710.1 glutamate racemase [Turicibacter sanguinis]